MTSNPREQLNKLLDPKFYLENFTKIKGKTPGLIPFVLNDAQKDLFNSLRVNPRVMILKARQIGFSTAVTGYLYHKTITNPGTNTALIGYNSDLTAELLDKVKTIYRTTPKSIQPTIQYNSKYEISFPAIDSKILVLPSSENVGRGYTLHNVLCVSGNTRVIMKNFSTRKVSEISPGDEIINGNGGFSVVSKAIKSQNNKKLLRIISYGSDDLVVTEDHKIMTREKFTGRPIWKKAGELTKNDYLAYPYFQNRNKPVPLVVTDLKCGRRLRGKNYYWSRISSVQEAPNEEYVYDLSLSGDPHSFLTHAGVVSNCTELAFWDKAEEKMLAIENAVPQNGSIVIESTPNAIGNLYHRMWMADNGYDKKKYGWWWHYTEAEIEIIRKRINNPMRFAQEYELEFLSTGRPVFQTDLVKKCRKNILHVGDKVRDENKTEYTVTKDEDGFVMYFPPRPGRIYAVGADVAEGVTGGDLSVAVVWDRATGEEVGFWRGYMPPDRFGIKLNKWGRLYNNALMVVEINNHGLTTVTALKNLLYPQMYFRQANYDSMGTSWSDRLGWKTTKVTRPLMIDDLRDALQERSITIHSESTLDEMLTFVFDDGGNMVAQNSFHDDCIFASAIGFQGFKVLYGGKLEQINYSDHLPVSSPY